MCDMCQMKLLASGSIHLTLSRCLSIRWFRHGSRIPLDNSRWLATAADPPSRLSSRTPPRTLGTPHIPCRGPWFISHSIIILIIALIHFFLDCEFRSILTTINTKFYSIRLSTLQKLLSRINWSIFHLFNTVMQYVLIYKNNFNFLRSEKALVNYPSFTSLAHHQQSEYWVWLVVCFPTKFQLHRVFFN